MFILRRVSLRSAPSRFHLSRTLTMTSQPATSILHRTPWRPPVAVRAEGMYIDLDNGKRIIDAVGGAAVACIGNSVPEVQQAIKDQVDQVSYVYNMQLSSKPAEELAQILVDSSNGAFELVGYASGGSEAMEGVLKLARQYYYESGQKQRVNFIGRNMSYHGNTLGTLSVAMHPTRRTPYADVLDDQHFHHVSPAYYKRFSNPGETEAQYVQRLAQELEAKFIALGPDTVIGFVAETVSGATLGCATAPKGYFAAMKAICHKYGALFILDEVMCGMGRMGSLHAWETFGDGEAPDIQAVAKGLGGGYASIGAVLMSKKVAGGIRQGSGIWMHGHTYQGHPLACAASVAVQKYIASHDLLTNCTKQGAYLEKLLQDAFASPNAVAAPYIFDIRGGGLFWGIEFDFPAGAFGKDQFAMLVQARALEKGVALMGMTGGGNLQGSKGSHVMLAPAYNVTNEQLEHIVSVLKETVEEIIGTLKA
ncbi:PLP-dependent transferase [Cylindrobasidium torrendii FP15055 ss-10]|uniref:PLP-dependent transferase n=1 Tax=Cylindrobasidium torrendii FP15055 ss-10 TaxID=1314674 RepID=A0A0D7BQN8_9AGAR|nr:PLP-dependent transferase [Cylindrobasidium torrendii FP15055 ss-10]